MQLDEQQDVSLLRKAHESLLDGRQRRELGREGRGIDDNLFLAILPQQLLSLGLEIVLVAEDPVLACPTRLQHLKVAILLAKPFEVLREVRSLREISVEIAADHPMVLLLSGIAVEDLDLHARQIVRHNVAGHIDSFRREVEAFLHAVGPRHFFAQREVGDLPLVHEPQHLMASLSVSFFLQRKEYIYRIFVFTE